MKTKMITEFVNFRVLETVTTGQIESAADILNDFQEKQDGYIDAELVRGMGEDEWVIIYHYENMEKVKAIGEKMRNSKIFDVFMPLTIPGSVRVSFFNVLKKWQ